MAQMTITIPDDRVQDVLDAIAFFNPIPTSGDPPTPDFTKPQWARQQIRRYINVLTNRYLNHQARAAVTIPVENIADVT